MRKLILLFLLLAYAAHGQSLPGCATGTQCVTIQGFNPTGVATLAASSVSSTVAFPSTGSNLYALVTNNGRATAYAVVGNSSVVATPAGIPLLPGVPTAIPQGFSTNISAITLSGTASISIVSGSGVPTIIYTVVTRLGGGVPFGALNFSIVTGGTAVQVFNPIPSGGGFVTNPFDASESLFCDFVNVAAVAAPGASGTTNEIIPGQTFSLPIGLTGGILSCNAATTAHAFTAVGE